MLKTWKFTLLSLFIALQSIGQSLPSPEQFLGYPLGSKFTPHHKIVRYFEALAAAKPDMIKLYQYGKTYEGRPLMVAYISTPENIARLDAVKANNLRLAGIARDKMAPSMDMPATVWLSYNVHGSEPSSSEAAMKTV